MKLLMMRPSYRPELTGGTHLAIDLVNDFIEAGHTVELITPISGKYVELVDENSDECQIHRMTSRFEKKDVLSRILRYLDTSLQMYKCALTIDSDVLMTHSMPPLLGPMGVLLAKRKGVPVLYWEQDIISESLISTAIFGAKGFKQKLMYQVAAILERLTERGSTHIITISQQFKKMHTDRGVADNKVSVVYNWIDTDQVYPVARDDNPLFDELDIPRDKFIVSYCGNLGVPQNVEIMIDAAGMLKDNDDILFVILGGGSREDSIREYAEHKQLSNLRLYPLQPLERSHLVYSLGDVGLVIGRRGTSKNGFPSKTWSIMSAGQAMVACFDEDSELSSFVRQGECGLAIRPDSSEELANAIRRLYENPEATARMGLNGRRYVTKHFSRKTATSSIIKVAESLLKKHNSTV